MASLLRPSRPLLKALWGGLLVLSSLYCLLAFLPYTHYAFVKASPYSWLLWFVRFHPALFWLAALAGALAYWEERGRAWYRAAFAAHAVAGIWLLAARTLATIHSDWPAYGWAVLFLWLLSGTAAMDVAHRLRQSGTSLDRQWEFTRGVIAAVLAAVLFAAGALLRDYLRSGEVSPGAAQVLLPVWSVLAHVALAVALLSTLNLLWVGAQATPRPRPAFLSLLTALVFVALWAAGVSFLGNALSFQGWAAQVYGASLAAALVTWYFAMGARERVPGAAPRVRRAWLIAGLAALSLLAVALPSLLHDRDWNGALQRAATLMTWFALAGCLYRLRPPEARYSTPALLAILLITGAVYKGLEAGVVLWARPLGATDDEVSRSLEQYAARDVSFGIIQGVLSPRPSAPCGELCRILRQHSNLRDVQTTTDLEIAEGASADGPRPHIFLFVVDSLRPDYLGAYDPKVDFTPNLDELARDSAVFHRAYTPYAGTLLAEPAIWSGALLLHAHYLQPFSRVNSLEKLAKADGYRLVVSYDTVLRELLSPADNLVKLDADKEVWNRFEACSTIEQLQSVLDTPDPRPVLFFAQPMNVHQFARSDLRPGSPDWRAHPGFDTRASNAVRRLDGCLGRFIGYLKAKKLYDQSIIIVTSDHGDSLGDAGRNSHSLHIHPEVIRVPLVVRIPAAMRRDLVFDDQRLTSLTDITPTLYYLLGHRPVRRHPLIGRPLFARTEEELRSYPREELLLASDVRAAYGILDGEARFLFVTYDSPPGSYLFDLKADPRAERSILTSEQERRYNQRVIEHLQAIAGFYGYTPDSGTLLARH